MSDDSEFKPPSDEHDENEGIRVVGPSEPMPHWTEPATGEMPRLLFDEEPAAPDEDLEAWSSFAATPRWRSSADDWDDDADIADFGGRGDARRRAQLRDRVERGRVHLRRHDRAPNRSRARGDADPHRHTQRAPRPPLLLRPQPQPRVAPRRAPRRRASSPPRPARAGAPARADRRPIETFPLRSGSGSRSL